MSLIQWYNRKSLVRISCLLWMGVHHAQWVWPRAKNMGVNCSKTLTYNRKFLPLWARMTKRTSVSSCMMFQYLYVGHFWHMSSTQYCTIITGSSLKKESFIMQVVKGQECNLVVVSGPGQMWYLHKWICYTRGCHISFSPSVVQPDLFSRSLIAFQRAISVCSPPNITTYTCSPWVIGPFNCTNLARANKSWSR